MKISIKILITLVCFWPSFSEAQLVLTKDQCRNMALEYSQLITIADQQKAKASYEHKAYKAKYYPALSISGLYFYKPGALNYALDGGYLPTYLPGPDGQLQPNLMLDPGTGAPIIGPDGNPVFNQYAYLPDIDLELGLEGVGVAGLQLQQPIYMGGKIRSANKMAAIGEEISIENLRLKRNTVISETDQAFWQYLGVKEKWLTAIDYLKLLVELEKNVKDAYEVGMATRNDLLKVKVKYNEANLMVQKAQNGMDLSRMNLCRLIGLPFESEIDIDGGLDASHTVSSVSETNDLSQRPEYRMLEKDIALKERQVDLVRSDFLPQLGVLASYSYFTGVQLNGVRATDASFSALASLSVPIYSWGEGRNKVKTAQAEQRISESKFKQYQELMELELAKARYGVKDAEARLDMTQLSMEQAEENLKMSTDMYETGMETLSDHLEAQAQLREAKSEYIDALAELKISETLLLKAIGQLGDSIE